jgi:isopentenyldiphosphate isomerase
MQIFSSKQCDLELEQEESIVSELIDIYDATGQPMGYARPKRDVHAQGLWHRSFHCWFLNRSETGGSVLLQKRAATKKSWPNKFDITAAGHYQQGEGIEGGLREIAEELGIIVIREQLVALGVRVCVEEFEPGAANHELQDVYFFVDDRPLVEYRLPPEEVEGIVAVPIDEGLRLFSGEADAISVSGLSWQSSNGSHEYRPTDFVIRQNDFIPTLDNYNYKVFVLADRFMRGDRHLLI